MNAVFLDRDGTLNADVDGYPCYPSDISLYPFTASAIKIFNELGYKTIVVSNQSGVARGIVTIEQVDAVNTFIKDELSKQNAYLDLILYSPYYAKGTVEPYNIDHISRKPKPGMFFEALHHFPIKASQSYMIGDKDIDIEFGKSNGLTTILVKTGHGQKMWEQFETLEVQPDFVVANILSAALLIKALCSRR